MSLRLYNPRHLLARRRRSIWNSFELLDRAFRTPHMIKTAFTLPIDVMENDDEYQIIADLPGLKKEDIEVTVDDKSLLIKTVDQDETEEQEQEEVEETDQYLLRERHLLKFNRRINFSKPINSKEATISHENGVLEIRLPKAEEAKAVKLSFKS
ncbi:MAG: Hsp20/alpha crystallin family protein [Candidatus Heimdallarchaeota archaeon]|nr:Hsp20/alpha crystallin family protein [Candidatus Heimdallarchaeota archaeon]